MKSETKGQTLQFQLVQTESIGKPLLIQINAIRGLMADGKFIGDDPNARKSLHIEQVIALAQENGGWKTPADLAVSPELTKIISQLKETGVRLHPYALDKHYLTLSSVGASGASILVVDVSQTFRECEGQSVGIVNETGEILLSCDTSINQEIFSSENPSIKKIKESKFTAGSFESTGSDPHLYSFFQPSPILSVIGTTPSRVAFRTAYFMGLRMFLLLLCGLGIAILASVILAKRVTGPIEQVIDATAKISEGDFDFPLEVSGKNELKTLAESVKRMAKQIRNLIHSEIEKTKIQEQLAVAGELQKTLLPPLSVALKGFTIESLYLPAEQCGGDWWSYIERENKLILLIGDVTGHGYASALLVAAVRGGIALIEAGLETSGPEECDPSRILRTLNRVVYDSAQAQLSMTAQCVVIDRDTGEYSMANAAHPNAFYVQKSDHSLQSLSLSGVRLGETRNMVEILQQAKGVLQTEEKMILYTDGLQELGSEEKPLDKKGVTRFFRTVTQNSPLDIIQQVHEKLIPLNEGVPLRDDITLVIVERAAHA